MSAVIHTPRGCRTTLAGLVLLLAATIVFCAGIGAVRISPAQILSILASWADFASPVGFDATHEAVLLSIRLPRVLLGVLVGGGLAIAGAAMQGLFRNPLADPGLLGVSSGAALAAFAAIVLGDRLLPGMPGQLKMWLLPAAAFGGALTALTLLYLFSRDREGRMQVSVMLLAGIAVNALCGAGIGLFAFLSTDVQLRDFTFWNLGSLGGANWAMLAVLLPVLPVAGLLMWRLSRALNLLALGESEAAHLGVSVERLKIILAVLCALTVGAAVSASGAIGFVGLVVPHILRMAGGPDHRWLLPASFLGGAALLLFADVVARTLASPAELPIGILTALVGGPFFLGLLVRSRRTGAWT